MVIKKDSGSAGISTTRYYLSLDQVRGTGDVLLTGSRSVPALAAGGSNTGPATVTIPASTAVNSYCVLACADGPAKVAETSDTNNCIASTTTVQVLKPDLVETF